MPLLHVVAVLAVVGILLWLVPMNEKIKQIIIAVVAIAVAVWLLAAFGVLEVPSRFII